MVLATDRRRGAMAETIRRVDYFYVQVPDKPGEGVRLLTVLREAGINLLAFSGFPQGKRTQIDFIPEDPVAFMNVAKRAKWKISPKKTGFLVQGDDRVGACLDWLSKLAGAKINVTAVDAVSAGLGRYGAIFWVKSRDVHRAAKALGI
jgi:prephenate dehydratase